MTSFTPLLNFLVLTVDRCSFFPKSKGLFESSQCLNSVKTLLRGFSNIFVDGTRPKDEESPDTTVHGWVRTRSSGPTRSGYVCSNHEVVSTTTRVKVVRRTECGGGVEVLSTTTGVDVGVCGLGPVDYP